MKLSLIFFLSLFLFFSCKKEGFITSTDASVNTSVDTLTFGTVFTNSGSITQAFKIFNNNNKKILLSSVTLAGGASSPFKINVGGTAAAEVDNVQINANDSLYVFVQVNVKPSLATTPFILSDSILINYNGNKKLVQLQAYGQNAVFLKNQVIKGNASWNDALPYVIIGQVQVDTNATLHIDAGTKIYLHANAPFLVDGTLNVNGTKGKPVVFTGDRLDEDYKDLPASWPGIFFRPTSENNIMRHTIIKNAYEGIIAQNLSSTSAPKLQLSRSIINNVYGAGILAINTNIYADNCLISNCGSNVQLVNGGNYRFINCTIASYGNNFIEHKNPVLQLSDYINSNGTNYTASLSAFFQNCIFWGDNGIVDNEIVFDKQSSLASTVTFDHVLYKAKTEVANVVFISSVKNEDPMFDSINLSKNIYDFHFNNHPHSPAINAGSVTPFLYDLDDKLRDSKPDIGCYER